jgi:hypothetical protein
MTYGTDNGFLGMNKRAKDSTDSEDGDNDGKTLDYT